MKVEKGDQVYVLGVGQATVTRVTPDGGFDVQARGHGEVHFSSDGRLGRSGVQRVFYYDPVILTPPKDARLWNAFRRLAGKLYEELVGLSDVGRD